jgi:iron complex transport system permease protein
MATFTAAVQTFVQQQHTQQLQNVYSWLLGGFSTATWHDVAICAPYVVASSLVLVLHRRVLDVLSLGDDEASSLGIDVGRARLAIVVAATLGTAAAVSVRPDRVRRDHCPAHGPALVSTTTGPSSTLVAGAASPSRRTW